MRSIRTYLVAVLLLPVVMVSAQKKDSVTGRLNMTAPEYRSSSNDDARRFYELGHNAFDKGDLRGCIKYYLKAIKLDSNFVDAIDNCGIAYRHLDNLDSAVIMYKHSLRIMPNGKLAHQNLAVVYVIQGKYQEAFDEYAKVVEIDDNDPEGHYGEARVYIIVNQPEKALPEAEKALKLYQKTNPEYAPDAEVFVGLSYYYMGDKKNAKKHLMIAKKGGSAVPQKVQDDLDMN